MRLLLLALTGLCALQLAAAQGRSLVDAMPCQLMGKQRTNPTVQPPLRLLGDLGPRHAAAARLPRPARPVPRCLTLRTAHLPPRTALRLAWPASILYACRPPAQVWKCCLNSSHVRPPQSTGMTLRWCRPSLSGVALRSRCQSLGQRAPSSGTCSRWRPAQPTMKCIGGLFVQAGGPRCMQVGGRSTGCKAAHRPTESLLSCMRPAGLAQTAT